MAGSNQDGKASSPLDPSVTSMVNDMCAKLGASIAIRSLSLKILEAALPPSARSNNLVSHEEQRYFVACCIYVASFAETSSQGRQLPLSSVLAAAGGQLRIDDFFERAKLVAADSSRVINSAELDPKSAIQSFHQSFTVTADLHRKLRESIVEAHLIKDDSEVVKLVWYYFLVAKAYISKKSSVALASVNAFHLLLACISQLGVVDQTETEVDEKPPKKRLRSSGMLRSHNRRLPVYSSVVAKLCDATGGVRSEVLRFLHMMSQALPSALLETPCLEKQGSTDSINSFSKRIERIYEDLLESSAECMGPDERIFITSSELVAAPAPGTPTSLRTPPGSRVFGNGEDVGRNSNRFVKFVYRPTRTYQGGSTHAGPGDALDALAAVASSSPRSPAVGTIASGDFATPVSASLATLTWLHQVTSARPEVKVTGESSGVIMSNLVQTLVLDGVKTQVPITTPRLRATLEAFPQAWETIVSRVRNLCGMLRDGLVESKQRKESLALYFLALQEILASEAQRLSPSKLQALVQNDNFHKTILVCALEATAACYGRRNMSILPHALEDFHVSAFTVSKGIRTFVRSIPGLPRRVKKHLEKSEHRLLECVVWEPSSPLVLALAARDANTRGMSSDHQPSTVPGVPEVALEQLYRKLLYIAGERLDSLASLLGLDKVIEPIWEATKQAVVEKWSLLVGRHLDQIIMCCTYGIARVFRIPIKFKDITTQYRMLDHVNDPSFQHLLPGVYRDISIEKHRGDIIKFYNELFIPVMKKCLLNLQPTADASPVSASPTMISPYDRLRRSILSSPLRLPRDKPTPSRQFGNHITVSPLSPRARILRNNSSPFPRRASVTPKTRALYAFGESPSQDLSGINRTLLGGGRSRSSGRPAGPLSFGARKHNHTGASSIRRKYANMLYAHGVVKMPSVREAEENKTDAEQRSTRTEDASEILKEVKKNEKTTGTSSLETESSHSSQKEESAGK